MRPSEILDHNRERIRSIVREHGADNPRIFGSVARGDDHAESDFDILVDLPEGVPFHQIFRIEDALSSVLGRRVDVYPAGKPGSRFLEHIRPDLRPI